jgi:hypothetical protein
LRLTDEESSLDLDGHQRAFVPDPSASCALTVFASMPGSRYALAQGELVLSNAVFGRQLLANARFSVAQAGQRGDPGFETARNWRMSVKSLAHEVRAEARGYWP